MLHTGRRSRYTSPGRGNPPPHVAVVVAPWAVMKLQIRCAEPVRERLSGGGSIRRALGHDNEIVQAVHALTLAGRTEVGGFVAVGPWNSICGMDLGEPG